MIKFLENYFWLLCIIATLLGLLAPWTGQPFHNIALWLMGILFFSGLKIDFAAAAREFRRPIFLLYVCAMFLVVLPACAYLATRWVMPEFAIGVLILACMPAGVVTSSLTEIAGGNSALALVVTLATTLLCPFLVPVIISLGTGELAGAGIVLLAQRASYLAAILFVPLTAAWLVRRHWPAAVARRRQTFTGISIIFLFIVIIGAMSKCSADTMQMVHEDPAGAVKLMALMFAFSGSLHLAGWWIAPWRPRADRAALSITAAYVNNALAIAFAGAFFVSSFGAAAMLPAILLEIPMTLAILPVRWRMARRAGGATPATLGPAVRP